MSCNPDNVVRDVEAGVTLKADTLEELAEKMDVDPKAFIATIDRYNEMCKQGRDDDFYKEAMWLKSIDTAPYYACKIAPHPCCTRAGLRIGPSGRVLDRKGNDIKGLWASGLNAGAMFGLNAILGSASVSQLFGWLGVQDAHGVLVG
jgi:fumarate reductase flavoprotein subunit